MQKNLMLLFKTECICEHLKPIISLAFLTWFYSGENINFPHHSHDCVYGKTPPFSWLSYICWWTHRVIIGNAYYFKQYLATCCKQDSEKQLII